MKTLAESGEIKLSRKRPAPVAAKDADDNFVKQKVVWPSKIPSVVGASQAHRSPVTERSITSVAKTCNMNNDANNNNNGVKEDEVRCNLQFLRARRRSVTRA